MQLSAQETSRKAAFVLFLAVLLAFVAETQTTQYLQTNLGYKQPYIIFYVVHSCFLFSFPTHLVYVLLKTDCGLRPLLSGLKLALASQAITWNSGHSSTTSISIAKLVALIILITTFYNLPALLWFIAVALASVTDVTAIWNANAFFAYVFSTKLLGLKWSALRLFAVMFATLGVLVVVYGGSSAETSINARLIKADVSAAPAPFVGDVLTLIASVLYALYQVLYKKYVALPSDTESAGRSSHYRQLSNAADNIVEEHTAAVPRTDAIVYPLPFGLHSNLIASTIGLCTLLVFWIPIPFLHYYGIEDFRLPPNASAIAAIAIISTSGVVFNAGFMILLGIWGPVVASVGGLLTIPLTLISDLSFGTVALTFGGLLGTGMIICAFGILAYDIFQDGASFAVDE